MSAPSPFFKGTTLQYAWDNTSLSLLQACPYKYKLKIIEGWRPKSASLHLTFGGHYAKAQELFFKLRAQGIPYDDALFLVVKHTLEATWVNREVDGIGEPWQSDDTKKNRETLIRSIVWYFEAYRDDAAVVIHLADGTPAVELSFKFESGIKDPYGAEYIFTGHLDRVVDFGGTQFIMDQKTTGAALGFYYFSKFDLDTQMSQYTYAGKVVFNLPISGVIIDAAQLQVGATHFARGITMRSAGQLEEWHVNTADWISLAELFAGEGKYPQNRASCENYGGCEFKGICSKDPSVRQHFLETDFKQEFWNPLEDR